MAECGQADVKVALSSAWTAEQEILGGEDMDHICSSSLECVTVTSRN